MQGRGIPANNYDHTLIQPLHKCLLPFMENCTDRQQHWTVSFQTKYFKLILTVTYFKVKAALRTIPHMKTLEVHLIQLKLQEIKPLDSMRTVNLGNMSNQDYI